ncbi:MAG TPA: multicopper oxidase family protein [Gammaproteobacteria bacterium]
MLTRRAFIQGLSLAAVGGGCGVAGATVGWGDGVRAALKAAPARVRIAPDAYPETAVWAYNGTAPGPELRFRQGVRLQVAVDNFLEQPTTVHWHGLRVPNAMDGVAHLTQPPIAPGTRFVYDFTLPDAGTFWYHPHHASHEQVARGLYGALVVEEANPPEVDRDLTWVLSDWRLDENAAQSEDFGDLHDRTHAGRVGNAVALNGVYPEEGTAFTVRSGERLRLRLVNAATARSFALRFNGHAPRIIALDGQPVTPHEAPLGQVVLAPSQRADLILDCIHEPGARFPVADDYYPRRPFTLLEVAYADEAPLRAGVSKAPIALPPNPLAEPDLARAERHEVVFAGGAMGGMAGARLDGVETDLRTLVREHGLAWAVNGVAAGPGAHPRLLDLRLGGHYLLALHNDSAWDHPIHLHGHAFRVLTRNGAPVPHTPWRDTVQLRPDDRVEIAFVADNPGEWMFHCHVLDHQAGGMAATLRVG